MPGPKRLIQAAGGGPPSRILVCPQYAIMYLEGCHCTAAEGPNVGTRCIGWPVSTAHCPSRSVFSINLINTVYITYNVDIRPLTGNSKKLAVVREVDRCDGMAGTPSMNMHETGPQESL